MSKPIKWKRVEIEFSETERVAIDVAGTMYMHVKDSDGDEAEIYLRDPAKLRALAKAITEAADALEESQRVRFGDLKPGEWFRFDDDGPHVARVLSGRAQIASTSPNWETGCEIRQWNIAPEQPVIKLSATFTPVPSGTEGK